MRIEFLTEGSDDCPLVRLYRFSSDETERLVQFCDDLAEGRAAEVALHEQSWVEPVGGCRLFWRFDRRDLGVPLPPAGGPLVLALTDEGWREVGEKLEATTPAAGTFQWLNEDGAVSVLFSFDGLW